MPPIEALPKIERKQSKREKKAPSKDIETQTHVREWAGKHIHSKLTKLSTKLSMVQ